MKRLTISMSDELFEKLDSVENKSLFIRKLIERELDTLDSINDTDSNTPWERDITALKGNVGELFAKLSEIEKQINQTITQEIPAHENHPATPFTGIKEQLTENIEAGFSEATFPDYAKECPDTFDIESTEPQSEITEENVLNIPEQVCEEEYALVARGSIPADSQPQLPTEFEAKEIATAPETGNMFTNVQQDPLTEANPVDETTHEPAIVMPEPEKPSEAQNEQAFVMPEFETAIETKPGQTFAISEPEQTSDTQHEAQMEISELKHPFEMPDNKPETGEKTPFADMGNEPFVMPELSSPENAEHVPSFIPELNPPASNDNQTFTMPEFEPPAETQNEQAFVMPDLNPPAEMPDNKPEAGSKPPFTDMGNEPFVMPELSSPEDAGQKPPFMQEMGAPAENNNQPFTMPELKPLAGAEGTGTFITSELKPETTPFGEVGEQQRIPPVEKQPLFKIHSMDSPQEEKQNPFVAPAFDVQPDNIQAPPFGNSQPTINPPAPEPPMNQPAGNATAPAPIRNNSSKPDKLGSNILMYMPHGAKVKKDIIKSLISKQFSDSEIETKISEMASSGILKLTAENGTQFLIRP